MKKEKICTRKFVQTLSKYACLFFLIIFFAAFFLVLNSYLQSTNNSDPTPATTTTIASNTTMLVNNSTSSNTGGGGGAKFSFSKLYWVILVPLFLILLVIFIWCFYFRFVRAFLSRRKLVYVEVQSHIVSPKEASARNRRHEVLSRKEAKSNLKLVIETTTGMKLENEKFDRYWYDERKGKLTGQFEGANYS